MKIIEIILVIVSTFSGLLGMWVLFPAMAEQLTNKPNNKVCTKTFIVCFILEISSIYILYKFFDPI